MLLSDILWMVFESVIGERVGIFSKAMSFFMNESFPHFEHAFDRVVNGAGKKESNHAVV